MKNLAKVWVLCLALATLVSALHTCADTSVTKKVTLTLVEWSNSCVLHDYAFTELQASPTTQQTEAVAWIITCSFLNNSADVVTLSMSDLSSEIDIKIPASGFNAQISSWEVQWSIWNLENQTITSLETSQPIYTKLENKIWILTGTLTLQWTIPGWTPWWIYTGSIDLTLQHGGLQNSGDSQNIGD